MVAVEDAASRVIAGPPRFPVAGVGVSRTDYADATQTIIRAARQRAPFVGAATSVQALRSECGIRSSGLP